MLGEWNKCFPMLNHSISISAIGILLRFLTWEVCLEVPDHSINQSATGIPQTFTVWVLCFVVLRNSINQSGTGIHQRLLPWKVCLKMPNHSTSQSGTGTFQTLKHMPCLKEHFPTSIQNLGKLNNLKSEICNTFINDNRRECSPAALILGSMEFLSPHTIRLLIFIPFLNQVFWMLCYHIYLMCNHSILFCMYDWSLHWCSREYLLYPHLVLLIC